VSKGGLDAMCGEPPGGSSVSNLTPSTDVGAKIAASPSCRDMATDVGVPPGPERTQALLVEIAGGRRGAQLRGQVAAAKRGATREQIEEAFQEACLKAGQSCRGQTTGEVYKWLLKTTDSIVDDMRARLKREVLVDHSAREFQTVDPTLAPPDEVLMKREERAELDELTLAILDRLDERRRKVAVLHSHGLARNDIARHLGITARIVKRDVEGILAAGREQLTRVVGTGCPEGHKLVSRYAFGLAAGGDARRAQFHLATCARCGAMFERLDLWRERVAALVPMPPAIEGHAHIAERVIHAGSELVAGRPEQPRPAGMREHVAHAMSHVREQATAAYYRTVDPTPLVGVRPGAVATVVAGCLAIGGGATYCVQQGTDPIAAFTGLATGAHREHSPKPHAKRARAAQTATPPATTQTVAAPPVAPTTTAQTPPPQTTATPTTTTTTSAPPPAPQDQFEPTSPSTTTSQTSAHTNGSESKQPAPAPAGGPGEFDGP
jgi:DNA-directed RNA polymerase specialized sigma24 family protein